MVAYRILVSAQALGHCHSHRVRAWEILREPEKEPEPELDNQRLLIMTLPICSRLIFLEVLEV